MNNQIHSITNEARIQEGKTRKTRNPAKNPYINNLSIMKGKALSMGWFRVYIALNNLLWDVVTRR